MTTPGTTVPPGTPPPPSAPPLLRRRDDRVLRGVCAAIGRTTGTDPVLWRVVVGVLTVFGGTGLLLYVAGWLLIPEQGRDSSIAERVLRGRELPRATAVGVVVAAVVLLALVAGDRSGAAPLVALGLLAYVVLRRQPGEVRLATTQESLAPPAPAPAGQGGWAYGAPAKGIGVYGAPAQVGWRPDASTPGAWLPGDLPTEDAPAWVPPEPRRRSLLGLLTLSAALLVTGALLALHAVGVDGVTVGRVLAADLLVVGLGLLVGARWGRARWLVLPAAVLGLALAATASAQVPVALSAGERTWLVTADADHRLGFGDAVLDLRPLDGAAPATTRVRAELGAGSLQVELPPGLHVEITGVVAAGQVLLPGEPDAVEGTHLRVQRTYGPADAPLVRVDATIGAGELEVSRG